MYYIFRITFRVTTEKNHQFAVINSVFSSPVAIDLEFM